MGATSSGRAGIPAAEPHPRDALDEFLSRGRSCLGVTFGTLLYRVARRVRNRLTQRGPGRDRRGPEEMRISPRSLRRRLGWTGNCAAKTSALLGALRGRRGVAIQSALHSIDDLGEMVDLVAELLVGLLQPVHRCRVAGEIGLHFAKVPLE
jgi:hypothetical protein